MIPGENLILKIHRNLLTEKEKSLILITIKSKNGINEIDINAIAFFQFKYSLPIDY